jgi:hypothetical protein
MDPAVALAALREYKAHRDTYDKRDWEIERIYRAISKGKAVISVHDAIRRAGVDELGRPRLAIMRADQRVCRCVCWHSESVLFTNEYASKSAEWHFEIPWPNRTVLPSGPRKYAALEALLPRIPPQHRPAAGTLPNYHMLWEADWQSVPRDPYLLKRIGKDAWVVVAAWDLTDVEIAVMRAHHVA